MTAFPQLVRCAKHQLRPDGWMVLDQVARQIGLGTLEGPNLMLTTGVGCGPACAEDCEEHRGLHLPVLSLREG